MIPCATSSQPILRCPPRNTTRSPRATEAGPAWTAHTLARYVDHLLACFGPERLLWGSDWPVVDLAGGYERWARATDALLARLPDADRNAIMGGNARRFYGLDV